MRRRERGRREEGGKQGETEREGSKERQRGVVGEWEEGKDGGREVVYGGRVGGREGENGLV